MPSGKTHISASLILAASFGVAAMVSNEPHLLECAGGAMLGVLISPDLDVDKGNVSNFIIRKRMGNFAERAWRWFWKGYSSSFKHRGFASHFPIFSTFMRLSYVYFWVILIPHILIYFSFYPAWSLMYVLSWYSILFLSPAFFAGLAGSDLIHWMMDKLNLEKK